MTRTTKVALEVDEKPFVRGMDRAAKATEKLGDAAGSATGSATELAAGTGKATDSVTDLDTSATGAGKALGGLREDAKRLDRQIDETSRSVRDLAREIAHASDEALRADLSEKLSGQRSNLRGLTDLRKLLDFNDDEAKETGVKFGGRFAEGLAQGIARAGGPVSAGLSAVFGDLPPQAQVALGAGVLAAVGAVAPFIGGVVSGAVVGGVGLGGIAGGLVLAAKDDRVKAAGTALGTDLGAMLGRASAAFVPETLAAIEHIRREALSMEPDLHRAFTSAAGLVEPLLRGALRGVEGMMPGVIHALDRARPVIDAIADGLVELGKTIGDSLGQLADHADEGAIALRYLFVIVDAGIRTITDAVTVLTTLFDIMDKAAILVNHNVARYGEFNDKQKQAKDSSTDLGAALAALNSTTSDLADTTKDAADRANELNQAFGDLFDQQMSLDQANIAYKQGLVDLKTELTDGKRTLDTNTAAGRDNAGAVLDQIQKIKELRDARLAHGEALDQVNDKYGRDIGGLRATLVQLGYDKTAVDALVGAYRRIPDDVRTTVVAETHDANGALTGFIKKINTIDGRTITVYTRITSKGEYIPGQGTIPRRWGGATEHAATGLLRDAAVYSPASPARYAFAEPQTGGEAFIPKHGDRRRSLGILDTAAGWLGVTVVDQPRTAYMMGSSAPPPAKPSPASAPVYTPAQFGAAVRAALVGVCVQMDGRTVGYLQGREANLYART